MLLIYRPFAWYAKAYYSHFYSKKSSYVESYHNVVNVEQLLLDSLPRIPQFLRTTAEIRIFNIPFDATQAVVVKRLGSPNFRRTVTEQGIAERSTLMYKRSFFSDKAILQFNFLNNTYLSCSVTFVQRTKSSERVFLKIVGEKYKMGQEGRPEEFEGMVDGNGNLLLYEESVYSTLVYINAAAIDRGIQHQIEEKLQLNNLMRWKKEYRNWINQL